MKARLVRFDIRNFNPTLRRATERLNALCTPEAGFMLRRNADRVAASRKGDECLVQFHFDH
jgi:hypothetical protein